VTVRRIQCDEIWAFVYGKQKNVTAEQIAKGAGDVWTWTAIDADTKLILSYTVGDRSAATAHAFMEDVASRTRNRIQLTTDGYRVYAEAVEDAFGSDIDYAMLVKIYGASNDSPESRYSPATCIGCRTGVLAGNPDPDHISTSYVERQNLSMRMGMRRFTRLTNGFSKKLENHGHMVALYFMHCTNGNASLSPLPSSPGFNSHHVNPNLGRTRDDSAPRRKPGLSGQSFDEGVLLYDHGVGTVLIGENALACSFARFSVRTTAIERSESRWPIIRPSDRTVKPAPR
jgi:IS1 family transposase